MPHLEASLADVHIQPGALLTLCMAEAGSVPEDILRALHTPEQWSALLTYAGEFDLSGMLYDRIGGHHGLVPAAVLSDLQQQYLAQVRQNMLALQQVARLADAFAEEGIRLIALKGTAFLMQLYEDIGLRRSSDIDVLIEENAVAAALHLMTAAGFAMQSQVLPKTSHPDEHLHWARFSGHLPPFIQEGQLPVEIHLNLLGSRGKWKQAREEIWERAVRVKIGSTGIYCLSPKHALLHATTHAMKHIDEGVSCGKWLVDMVMLVRKYRQQINWHSFWKTATRWGIERDAGMLMGLLNEHADLDIPGIPIHIPPLPVEDALTGRRRGETESALRGYMGRLHMAGAIPDARFRLRYLFRLLFPTREYMAGIYPPADEHIGCRHYLRRLLHGISRIAAGIIRSVFRRQ